MSLGIKSSIFVKVERSSESIANLLWTYHESIVNLIIVHLSWIYRASIGHLIIVHLSGGGCPSTALHRHDQLAKHHPVPWLRWPNVSWHQVFHLCEPIVNLIIMHLSWIYRESIVNLSWIYREPIPDASNLKFEEFNLWKSWNFVWNGSIWLDMSSY